MMNKSNFSWGYSKPPTPGEGRNGGESRMKGRGWLY